MISYSTIDTSQKLIQITDSFLSKGIKSLAMDFEEESNLHVYGEHLCTIQLFDRQNYYLIDAIKICAEADGVKAIKYFLESDIEKIMFGCSSDAAIVRKTMGIKIANVYDVRVVALALEFNGNLTALIERNLHIQTEDRALKKKYQRANWMRRPLSDEQISYALSDVTYLFDLKSSLEDEAKSLDEVSRRKLAHELRNCASSKHNDRPGWEKICNYKRLNKREKVFIRHFFLCRDNLAKRANVPPTNIVEKQTIVAMAKAETWQGLLEGPKLRYCKPFEGARLDALDELQHIQNLKK